MFNKLGSKGLFGRCTENDFDRHLRAYQADKQLAPLWTGRSARDSVLIKSQIRRGLRKLSRLVTLTAPSISTAGRGYRPLSRLRSTLVLGISKAIVCTPGNIGVHDNAN